MLGRDFDDLHQNSAHVRLFMSFRLIALARHPCPALTAKYLAPRSVGMVFADEAYAEAHWAFWISQRTLSSQI
jgi:hypothetical protein